MNRQALRTAQSGCWACWYTLLRR